jgi:hypothetical protein
MAPMRLYMQRFQSRLELDAAEKGERGSATTRVRGGTRIRTGESRFCRPLPYHLAMPPMVRKV